MDGAVFGINDSNRVLRPCQRQCDPGAVRAPGHATEVSKLGIGRSLDVPSFDPGCRVPDPENPIGAYRCDLGSVGAPRQSVDLLIAVAEKTREFGPIRGVPDDRPAIEAGRRESLAIATPLDRENLSSVADKATSELTGASVPDSSRGVVACGCEAAPRPPGGTRPLERLDYRSR